MNYRIVLECDVGVPPDRDYWWWVLKSAGNGAVLATSETYTTRAKAFKTAVTLAQMLGVEVEDRWTPNDPAAWLRSIDSYPPDEERFHQPV